MISPVVSCAISRTINRAGRSAGSSRPLAYAAWKRATRAAPIFAGGGQRCCRRIRTAADLRDGAELAGDRQRGARGTLGVSCHPDRTSIGIVVHRWLTLFFDLLASQSAHFVEHIAEVI
jgi:hypothetical protein